jgi:hypothetical protein
MKLRKLHCSTKQQASAAKSNQIIGHVNTCMGDVNNFITFKAMPSSGGGKQSWQTSPSKSTNILLSIKTTTKMKRSHNNHKQNAKNTQLQQGLALFASENFNKECVTCKKVCSCKFKNLCDEENESVEDEVDCSSSDSPIPAIHLVKNHSLEKSLKQSKLKSFGVSIANIFKPNVKHKFTKMQNKYSKQNLRDMRS